MKVQKLPSGSYRVQKTINGKRRSFTFDHKPTQKEIEEYFKVSHPTVVGIVSRMENNGYLHCYTDVKDRRQKICELTEAGYAVCEIIHTEITEGEKLLVEGLSEAEIAELMRMLEIIYHNLSD